MHMAELEMKEDIARENTLKVKKTNRREEKIINHEQKDLGKEGRNLK